MNMIKMVVGTKQITEVIKIFPSLIGICLITSLWRWWGQKKQWDPIIASPAPLSSPNEKLQKCKSAPKQPIVHFICTHCPVSEQDLILLQRAFYYYKEPFEICCTWEDYELLTWTLSNQYPSLYVDCTWTVLWCDYKKVNVNCTGQLWPDDARPRSISITSIRIQLIMVALCWKYF